MRRIEPAFPDLLPLTHRLGGGGAATTAPRLEPVGMRLVWPDSPQPVSHGDRSVPRRPVRLLAHAAQARRDAEHLGALLAAGCGVVLVLDDPISPSELPAAVFPGQMVALAPSMSPLWAPSGPVDLAGWSRAGVPAGILLALAPSPSAPEEIASALERAAGSGAGFVLAVPLSLPPEDRHRVYDALAGELGDASLEDLLFHTDLSQLCFELERETTRGCRRLSLPEGLPGPATAAGPARAFAASASLLLWARRLDLLDGVSSTGWQLRRAAKALLASGRDPQVLVAEDNLRIVPGFSPWVEAFARTLWCGAGEPFEEILSRWVAQ